MGIAASRERRVQEAARRSMAAQLEQQRRALRAGGWPPRMDAADFQGVQRDPRFVVSRVVPGDRVRIQRADGRPGCVQYRRLPPNGSLPPQHQTYRYDKDERCGAWDAAKNRENDRRRSSVPGGG